MKIYLFTFFLCLAVLTSFGQTNNLNIEKCGNRNQTIILISGLACKNEIWLKTVDSLKQKNTVYIIDYYSSKENQLNTINQISIQITNWIKSKKLVNPIIIGHSLGGVVALDIATNISGNIKRLVILDSYPAISAMSNPNFTSNSDNDCSVFVSKFTSISKGQFRSFQENNYAQMTNDSLKRKMLVDWVVSCSRVNYSKLLCDYMNIDLRKKIASIDCPTLILTSKNMIPLSKKITKQYQNIKNHKIIYSENGLHFLMFDDFDWYITKTMDFIR